LKIKIEKNFFDEKYTDYFESQNSKDVLKNG
jgi:hypothetical protein